ncbi:hypothetical protein CEXT_633751 [Caerostris extrusa]|uniref:Uncharacterized protein n=1 Tax=Caerostris extrusa TaxID=172846 RepID=A0AAV4UND8_CAEEX|nr:hypothetical protein CEXT_633751 [Caerostris extrusa]
MTEEKALPTCLKNKKKYERIPRSVLKGSKKKGVYACCRISPMDWVSLAQKWRGKVLKEFDGMSERGRSLRQRKRSRREWNAVYSQISIRKSLNGTRNAWYQ